MTENAGEYLDDPLRLLDEFMNRLRVDAETAGRNASGVERTGDGAVTVTSKELVMRVLLGADENYSMRGHVPLAEQCFGQFYLMLDKSPEYERQAQKINAVLQSITEKEAFDLALTEARKVLAAGPADERVVAAKVATGLCVSWFDLPDGNHVKAEWEVRSDPTPPARCPSDFIWPSAYLFLPVLDAGLEKFGPVFGQLLRESVLAYVEELRSSDQRPNGAISGAIFDTFSSEENELTAQTIVGLMVGLLPPVILNIFNAVDSWKQPPTTYASLQEALRQHGGGDPYLAAKDVLKQPLMRAIQKKPMPPAIWRTAEKDHMLGTVQIRRDDKISLQIINATQEDLQNNRLDVFPVFGGNRSAMPHPTHACPALEAAFGIMLGTIYGLMETA